MTRCPRSSRSARLSRAWRSRSSTTTASRWRTERPARSSSRAPAASSGYAEADEASIASLHDGRFFTGDLGRLDEDGRLYLQGRKKLLIEVGGYKVDPIEVEDVIKAHPCVSETIVVGVAGESEGEETVKAVVVPSENCDESELISFCRERLANFKVPRSVEFRDEIPKSPLGKILQEVPRLKTLLIDNYDSFTYNLFQLLAEANGDEPIVVRNDSAELGRARAARLRQHRHLARPRQPRPRGRLRRLRGGDPPAPRCRCSACASATRASRWVHGGQVLHAPEVMHGRISAVLHDDSPLFAGIPREFQAVRYHSLCVEEPCPPELESIARTSDGVVMAVAHRTRPQWGVQFHPESICTEYGRQLLANFRDLTAEFGAGSANGRRSARRRAARATPSSAARSRAGRASC